MTVDGAVSGGEGIPEVDGGVGIHWVRRVYACYEKEAERGGEESTPGRPVMCGRYALRR